MLHLQLLSLENSCFNINPKINSGNDIGDIFIRKKIESIQKFEKYFPENLLLPYSSKTIR